ncbi:hypothetical protein HYV88_00730 [Candidatus Woesearchaeota archaeon]|nr:hypothetical protein [Candidatus Woesearchaeota archaeon]
MVFGKILCKLGFHKWSKEKFWTSATSNIRDYQKYCLRCKKIEKRTEIKE